MKTRLMHVRANGSDLKRAVEWYERVLGFKVEANWPPEKPNYVHFKAEKGALFAIMESEEALPATGSTFTRRTWTPCGNG
jgi:predicted enzyme related to lactoylglutathione lyase